MTMDKDNKDSVCKVHQVLKRNFMFDLMLRKAEGGCLDLTPELEVERAAKIFELIIEKTIPLHDSVTPSPEQQRLN